MAHKSVGDPLHVWGIPLLLAVTTLIGLMSALTGTGGLHYWLSWVLLALPVGVSAWFGLRRR